MLIWLAILGLGADDPTPPKPKASPATWVTENDYPPAAIRAGQSGTVGFMLEVDPSGKVANCTVSSSSGSSLLDSTTCQIVSARAAFTPAKDAKGKAVAGKVSLRFRWQFPEPNAPIPWTKDQDIRIETDRLYGSDGVLVSCKATMSNTVGGTSEQFCAEAPHTSVVRTIDGKPVSYHEIVTVTQQYRRE